MPKKRLPTVMEIYKKAGKTNLFFISTTTELFRTWRPNRTFAFEPSFKYNLLKDSGPPKDIAVYRGDDNMWWVEAGSGGVSMWDKPLKIQGEHLFLIPTRTLLPQGLIFSRDRLNDRRQATHYTIHPLTDMPQFNYTHLLFKFELSLRPRLDPPRPR